MSNVTLPGTGAVVATDDVDGASFQLVKLDMGAPGSSAPLSGDHPLPANVVGELLEAIEALRMTVASLSRTIGLTMPDTAGRMRVLFDTTSNLGAVTTVTTVTTVSTVSTVSTLNNQAQAGGIALQDQVPALMRIAAAALRSNITIS